MIVVLDTNILISAMIMDFGVPARVLDLVLAGETGIAVDNRILAEYREVLARPKFKFDSGTVEEVLTYIETNGMNVIALPLAVNLPDLDDAAFLEVAHAAHAVLITGNLRHYPSDQRFGVTVLSPAEFLASWQSF
jgi:putative PIN family toxin of toxin-antitoxin system